MLTPDELIEDDRLQTDVHKSQPCQQLVELAVTSVYHHILGQLKHLRVSKENHEMILVLL